MVNVPMRFTSGRHFVVKPNEPRRSFSSAPMQFYQNIEDYYQHNFDGIDDYATVPTIELLAGDVVDVEFIAPVGGYGGDVSSLAYGATTAVDGRFGVLADGTLFYRNYASMTLDGDAVITDVTVAPTDGLVHKVVLIAASNTNNITVIGANSVFVSLLNSVIKNLRITRANPTDTHPNLYWPMDDGPGTTVMRQTIPHGYPTLGYMGFDSDGQTWINYLTDPAPQYVGVTGYETLAERAALSGLSEIDEAIASCREGDVRNGDFRFGDNGDWSFANNAIPNFTSDGLEITRGTAGLDAFAFEDDINIESSTDYIASILLDTSLESNPTDANSVEIRDSDSNTTINAYGVSQDDLLLEVPFTTGATATDVFIRLRVNSDTSLVVIKEVSIRKATSQQVLTPTVNDGEYVNFNDENWELVNV